jgi:hypothetical protein
MDGFNVIMLFVCLFIYLQFTEWQSVTKTTDMYNNSK